MTAKRRVLNEAPVTSGGPVSAAPELGVIEGYYGRPWQHADRKQVVSHLRELGYGFFHFAPKADPFLRRRWREPHPDAASTGLVEVSMS